MRLLAKKLLLFNPDYFIKRRMEEKNLWLIIGDLVDSFTDEEIDIFLYRIHPKYITNIYHSRIKMNCRYQSIYKYKDKLPSKNVYISNTNINFQGPEDRNIASKLCRHTTSRLIGSDLEKISGELLYLYFFTRDKYDLYDGALQEKLASSGMKIALYKRLQYSPESLRMLQKYPEFIWELKYPCLYFQFVKWNSGLPGVSQFGGDFDLIFRYE